jgi:predicted MFS family arabinose efflux permease
VCELKINNKKLVFALLCLQGIVISFNISAVAALIPSISYSLCMPDFLVAEIIPFYMIPYGLGALIYAPLVRVVKPKIIMLSSFIVFTIFSLICAATNSLELLAWARAFTGIAAASVIPLSLIIIAELGEKEIRGRMVGVFFSTTFIASIAGVALSSVVGWRFLFYLPAILGLVTTLLIFLLFPDEIKQQRNIKVNYINVISKPEIFKIFFFIFLISMIYHATFNWLGVYLDKVYNLSQFKISMFITAIGISGAFGQILGGFLSDKKGRIRACNLGLMILAVTIMLLYVKFPLWFLAVVFIAFGIGWTINHNSLATILTDFPDEYRASVASLNSSVRFISGGLGASLGGMFFQYNFGYTFLAFGILLLVLSVYSYRFIYEI